MIAAIKRIRHLGVALPDGRRRWRTRWARILIATQVFVAVLLVCRASGWLQPAELFFYDRLVAAWAAQAVSDKITLITISEDDIDQRGWPLRDADLAALLERLTAWGARAVGVDLYRDRPLPPGTEQLERVRQEHPEIIWSFKLGGTSDHGVAPPPLTSPSSLALADVVTDAGGVVRRGLLAASDPQSGETFVTLGAALAEAYTGDSLHDVDNGAVALGAGRIDLITRNFGPYADVDAAGYQTMLDFVGGPDRFERFSVAQLMTDNAIEHLVRGRIVLIGTGALSVKDNFATPLTTARGTEPVLGVMLHAHLADQLIRIRDGEASSRDVLPGGAEGLMIWVCALAAALAVLVPSSVIAVLVIMTLGLGLIAIVAYLAFGLGLILPGFALASAWAGAGFTGIVALHGIGIRDRLRLRRSFEHYLDPRIINEMLEQDVLPEFGGEYREISVVFTDLTGFTSMSETLPAVQVAALMRDYFDAICAPVVDCGGLVSEFMGDGLLALFGAPQAQDDHADRAIDAALRIDAVGCRFSAEQRANGIDWGNTRIGVHSGMAMVGNVGTRGRLHYGAVGDVINTASRLVGVNKRIGTRIAASSDTMRLCRRNKFQPVGEFILVGRHGSLLVVTPSPADAGREQELAQYSDAYRALKEGSGTALEQFAALRREYPEDPCVALHLSRLATGESGVLIRMEEK